MAKTRHPPGTEQAGTQTDAEAAPDNATREGRRRNAPFLLDQPIKDEADDRLGYAEYANAVFSLIDLDIAETPCVIAVNGQWGSGKTSLAHLVEQRLRGRPTTTQPHLTCWFNAWLHADADDLRSPLISTVARHAASNRRWIRRALRPLPSRLCQVAVRRVRLYVAILVATGFLLFAALTLGRWNADALHKLGPLGPSRVLYMLAGLPLIALLWNIVMPVASSVSKYVGGPTSSASTADMERTNRQLAKLIAEATRGKRKFLLFVDDLDRCPAGTALKICGLAVQLLAHKGVFIVLLADMQLLERHATKEFIAEGMDPLDAAAHGRLFLEKLIQLQIDLPEPSMSGLDQLPLVTVSESDHLLTASSERLPIAAYMSGLLVGFMIMTNITSYIGIAAGVALICLIGLTLVSNLKSAELRRRQENLSRSVDASIRHMIEFGQREIKEITERVVELHPELEESRSINPFGLPWPGSGWHPEKCYLSSST